jgi:hypothetical protein
VAHGEVGLLEVVGGLDLVAAQLRAVAEVLDRLERNGADVRRLVDDLLRFSPIMRVKKRVAPWLIIFRSGALLARCAWFSRLASASCCENDSIFSVHTSSS